MPARPRPNTEPYPPGWEPFLAAIKADVDDDTHRLVFADWLEENGDPERGELIRLQCGTLLLSEAERDAGEREDTLVQEHWDRWVADFPHWVHPKRSAQFVRGFLSEFEITGARLVADGERIARLTPVQSIRLLHPTVESLRSPVLAQLSCLRLEPVDSKCLAVLADHPNLSLHRLVIGTGGDSLSPPATRISAKAIKQVLANPGLAELRQFRLQDPYEGDAVATALAEGQCDSLEQLDLTSSGLTLNGMKSLAKAACGASLRKLYIAFNPIGDDGIQCLVESPTLRNLRHLTLMGCGLTARSARLLARWPGLRTIEWMEFRAPGLTREDADLILSSPYAVALTKENLYV